MADLSQTNDFLCWLKNIHPEIHLLPWQEDFVGMFFKNKERETWNKHLLVTPLLTGRTFIKNLISEFERRI